jgi:rubrerythrin
MSIIYDRKEIRSRMRDEPVAKCPPADAPDPEWVCLSCGFWEVRPKGSACPICHMQEGLLP